MNKFSALKSKIYSYLTDYNNEDKKKAKSTKVCCKKIKFEDYKHCLEVT